jgi:Kef-type K+ transport system membrane component KefB
MEISFFPLAMITTIALFAHFASRRLNTPVIVVEILFGILIGKNVLNLIEVDAPIEFLGLLGFIFLMFLSGLEIDFNQIESRGWGNVFKGFLVFVLILTLSYSGVYLLKYEFLLAIVFSTTSLGVVVPTIRELRLSKSDEGQSILLIAMVADFFAILLLTFYAVWLRGSGELPIFIGLTLFFAYAIAYVVGKRALWLFPDFLSSWFKPEQPTEIGVRAAIAIMLGFVAYSRAVGVEEILGAFLAGVLLSVLFRGGSILEEKLYAIGYGFLIPIFFIGVGMNFRFDLLLNRNGLMIIPPLILIAFIVKIIPSIVVNYRRLGFKDSIASGILLTSNLSLVIAAAEIGRRLNLIDEALEAAIIFLAIFTTVVCPTVFRRMSSEQILKETENQVLS